MEHSPLERKLPVKKHHQKLVEGGEDSGFEVNLFLRHSAPVCFSCCCQCLWDYCCSLVVFVSLCFPLFPPFSSAPLFQDSTDPGPVSPLPRLFLQTMATITATADPGTELCPGWCLPQTMALNFLQIPTLLFQRMW